MREAVFYACGRCLRPFRQRRCKCGADLAETAILLATRGGEHEPRRHLLRRVLQRGAG